MKETLKERLLQFVSEKGIVSQAEIRENFIEQNEKSVAGRLSELCAEGALAKDGGGSRATYRVAGAKTEPKAEKTAARGITSILDRPLTEKEAENWERNARKYGNVELEPVFETLIEQMKAGDVRNILFIGPAGTGKTSVAKKIFVRLGLPAYSSNFSKNIEEADIFGAFKPNGEPGNFPWKDGEYTKSHRDGGGYIAEELNFADAGVLGKLYSPIETDETLELGNGEIIERHPQAYFIANINLGKDYASRKKFDLALLNRFQRVYWFEEMPEEKKINIIIERSGYQNREIIEKMLQCGDAIRQKIKIEDLDCAVISIRNLISWATDVKYTKNAVTSAWPTVVHGVVLEDETAQKEIVENIIAPKFGNGAA